jgi:hypothetical protein
MQSENNSIKCPDSHEIECADPNAQPTADVTTDIKPENRSKERTVEEVMKALRKIEKAKDRQKAADILGIPQKTINHYKLYVTKARRLGIAIKEFEKRGCGFGSFVEEVEMGEKLTIKQIIRKNKKKIAGMLQFPKFKVVKQRITCSKEYLTILIRVCSKIDKSLLKTAKLKYDAKQRCILKEVFKENYEKVEDCIIEVE